jgi:hypothetical protein
VRPGKDRKENALLKLLAGLLGIGFDELKRRKSAAAIAAWWRWCRHPSRA